MPRRPGQFANCPLRPLGSVCMPKRRLGSSARQGPPKWERWTVACERIFQHLRSWELVLVELLPRSNPRHGFLLDETHLRIVTRSADAPGDTSPLSRDPHLTPRRRIIPLRGPSIPLETESRLIAQVRFRPALTLIALHHANLVHCYPRQGTPRTIVVSFWDEEHTQCSQRRCRLG